MKTLVRTLLIAAGCSVMIGSLAAPASADHAPVIPTKVKAKKIQMSLIRSYQRCTAPNQTTMAGLPACAPELPSDTVCTGFDEGGQGQIQASVVGNPTTGTADVKIKATAKGLHPSCEGRQLCAVVETRVTADDCPVPDACTTIDLPYAGDTLGSGCCLVVNGKCTISTTLNANPFADPITSLRSSHVQVTGLGLYRVTIMGTLEPTLIGGLLVP